MFVGFTLTTDPFRVGSCLIASDLIASLENPTERKKSKAHVSARFWPYILYIIQPKPVTENTEKILLFVRNVNGKRK